jgi:phenylpropionate dioxygenase-like ring-hydroxylating dioxygenase large terminal subunit
MRYNILMATVKTKYYVNPEHLHKEKKRAIEGSWVLAASSAQLPASGSEWLFEIDKYSILLLRGKDNTVRAFHNSCLHRGTKLNCHHKKTKKEWFGRSTNIITCPYHGWQYDLKGNLRHIPKKEGISLKYQTKLKEYETHETAGFIWVCLGQPKENATVFLSDIPNALKKYKLQEMIPIEARDFQFPVNWKICLENSLDYYHVSSVHGSTVNAHVKDSPSFHKDHLHSLQTLHIAPYRWRSWFDKMCIRRDVYTPQEISSLHKYFIFPNLVLNVLPYHLTIMQIWPIDEKNCIMRYRFCFRQKASLPELGRAYVSWLASRYILYEDIKIYQHIQKGMELSELIEQPLHKEERGIQYFHHCLDKWMVNQREP